MAIRIKARFFERALCDEVQLAEDARAKLSSFPEVPLSADQVLQLGKTHTADLAARTFYESLLISEHGKFINQLSSYSASRVEQPAQIKLYVLPGMFYREHPEMGGDGSLVKKIGGKFGFDAEIIQTESTGSVSTNSAIIAEKLSAETHSNIWLISISKGASDLRHYLQNHEVNNNIRGCINVAGIPKGLPFIDHKLSSPFKRLLYRVLCFIVKIDYQSMHEMQTRHDFWKNKHWRQELEMIHMLPVPHSAHLHNSLRAKYHLTLEKGPNDGFIPLTDVLDLPGKIVPLWGCDHFLRTHRMSGYLYQLFNYISDQYNQQRTK